MARAPYQPIEDNVALRPQAAPTDSFVRAAEPPRDNALMDLARGLSKLDPGLSGFLEDRKAEQDKEDALRGEAEFHKNNRVGYAEAVAQGLIPAYASKSFVSAYKQAQGSAAGYDLEQKFNAAYDAWGDKDSEEPGAFDNFVGGFLKENLKTDDPDVLRGLMPRVRSITEQGTNRYQTDRHNSVMNGSIRAHSAEVDNAIDEENSAGLGSEKGPDYPKLFTSITAIRQRALDSGVPADKIDPQIVDAVTAKAIELRDPKVLDFLDQNVPGTSYSWKDTPYGRKAKAETIQTLEVMGRQAIEREYKEHQERDRTAKNDVTRRTVEAIIANPNGPLPDELLNEGTRYDPNFKIDAMKWKADVYRDRGTSDPDALMDLNWEILNGGGIGVIRRGMEMGVFGNKEDLVSAFKLLQEREKGGTDLEGALNSNTARTILGTIKHRTLSKADQTAIYSPDGLSDVGLAASYDFKRHVMAWLAANPNADFAKREAAINDIGAQILSRLGREDEGAGKETYNRDGFRPDNPYAPGYDPRASDLRSPESHAPARSIPQQQQPAAPSSGATPPATVRPPKPEEVKAWFETRTPEQQAHAQKRATERGVPLETLLAPAYQERVLKGLIKAPETNPQQPAPGTPQTTGSVEPTVQPASFEAGNIVGEVASVIQQWSEEDPVAQDVINQVGSLIEQAINGTGDFTKGFSLAALTEDPRAARILDFIAGPESGGNYNAYYGNSGSTRDLSKLTLDQILRWQGQRTASGSPSSATGRYQFMRKTLLGLKKSMGLTGSEKFTPELQDRMAFQLMRGRGYDRWKAGKMSTTTFANELAKEWAGLPNLRTGRSHYAGDGLNKSGVSPAQVLNALDPRKA
jgi:muramidase (phage lysozyme)